MRRAIRLPERSDASPAPAAGGAARNELRLRWNLAALVFEAKLAFWRDRADLKYSPDQPRVSSGDPRGGQWTRVGGGGGRYTPVGGDGEYSPEGDVVTAEAGSDQGSAALDTPVDPVQLAANDGTPGNNQAQNKQIDDISRMLGLTKDQRRQLHKEISGENFGFTEILKIAKDLQK